MKTYTIIYKSGQKIRVKAEGLTVTKSGSEIREVSWKLCQPRPFVLGVDHIAAIFEGKV